MVSRDDVSRKKQSENPCTWKQTLQPRNEIIKLIHRKMENKTKTDEHKYGQLIIKPWLCTVTGFNYQCCGYNSIEGPEHPPCNLITCFTTI